jgi:hypothetical protein
MAATHECSACLERTVRGDANPPNGFVLAISECAAVGTGGTHNWVRIQQGNKKNSKNKKQLPSFIFLFFLSFPLLSSF